MGNEIYGKHSLIHNIKCTTAVNLTYRTGGRLMEMKTLMDCVRHEG